MKECDTEECSIIIDDFRARCFPCMKRVAEQRKKEERPLPPISSAFDVQVGGDHYKDFPIQPALFCQKNELNWCEANIVYYAVRHKGKNGREDLEKIKDYVDMLIEMEYPDEEKQ